MKEIASRLIIAFVLITVFSFTNHVNAQAPPDMSQMSSAPKMVSGAYSNSDYGVQMTIPDGWSGAEMKMPQGMTTLSVVKDTRDSSNSGFIASTISVMMGPKTSSTADNSNIPNDPKYKCDVLSSDNTNVNGMSATVSVVQCTSPDGGEKMKSYSFNTDTNGVYVSYMAAPISQYDSDVGTFESLVKTLQIANTVSAPSAPPATSSAVPEFPSVGPMILIISVMAIIGFTFITKRKGLLQN